MDQFKPLTLEPLKLYTLDHRLSQFKCTDMAEVDWKCRANHLLIVARKLEQANILLLELQVQANGSPCVIDTLYLSMRSTKYALNGSEISIPCQILRQLQCIISKQNNESIRSVLLFTRKREIQSDGKIHTSNLEDVLTRNVQQNYLWKLDYHHLLITE